MGRREAPRRIDGGLIVDAREDRVRPSARHKDRDLAAAGRGFVHARSLARAA